MDACPTSTTSACGVGLGLLDTEQEKYSYVVYCIRHRHIFHYIVEDQIIYLCMTDNDLKRRVPFMFLEDMKVSSSSCPVATIGES